MTMKKIVGIGACTLDTLISVPTFPTEDTKVPASSVKTCGGGPTATALCAAVRLGAKAAFLGDLASDEAGSFLKKDFEDRGVSTDCLRVIPGASSFRSTLLLSQDTGSRTCLYDRGTIPASPLGDSQKSALLDAALLMVDGNYMAQALEAAAIARGAGIPVFYDCGGVYDGCEKLLSLTDICIPSENFALRLTGKTTAEEAAMTLFDAYRPQVVVVTQGAKGGILYDGKEMKTYPVFPTVVVDSNGSGDVFHGAFAVGLLNGFTYEKCCLFASAVSALKCAGIGARDSVPAMDEVKKYMKENGYEL